MLNSSHAVYALKPVSALHWEPPDLIFNKITHLEAMAKCPSSSAMLARHLDGLDMCPMKRSSNCVSGYMEISSRGVGSPRMRAGQTRLKPKGEKEWRMPRDGVSPEIHSKRSRVQMRIPQSSITDIQLLENPLEYPKAAHLRMVTGGHRLLETQKRWKLRTKRQRRGQ